MKRKFESCTSIGLYKKCPYAYYAKYGLGYPDPSGPEATFGTMVHESIYGRWHTRTSSHVDERVSRMLECLWNDPRVIALPKVKLVRGKSCEKETMFEIGGVMVKGYIDIDLREYGVKFPIDIKTSSKKIDARKLKSMYQHMHYPTVLGADEFLYLLITAPKMMRDFAPVPMEEQLLWTPDVQWKKLFVDETQKLWWEDEVRDVAFRIALDQFEPKMNPLCAWCPFQKKCPAWR